LVDPMLGTGGSAGMAVKILKNHGVEEENITFLTIISCENGLTKLFNDYPKIKIITA
jgi:uracil phosphoribosyltransferase